MGVRVLLNQTCVHIDASLVALPFQALHSVMEAIDAMKARAGIMNAGQVRGRSDQLI